jgi:hypothetical protein
MHRTDVVLLDRMAILASLIEHFAARSVTCSAGRTGGKNQ